MSDPFNETDNLSWAAIDEPAPMTPPIQRARMLPEPIEFPVHDWFRRLFRRIGAR
jgi:hypothetical protein